MLSVIAKFGYFIVLIEFHLVSTGNACTFVSAFITTENNRLIHENARKLIDNNRKYLEIYCLESYIYIYIYQEVANFSIAEAQSVKVNYLKINWHVFSNFVTANGTAYYYFHKVFGIKSAEFNVTNIFHTA
jgi:hypothetical protein